MEERPAAWLEYLQQHPQEYRRLLEESQCVAHLAYRIAKARLLAGSGWLSVPSAHDVRAAALEVQRNVPELMYVPSTTDLWKDCAEAGLPIIPAEAAQKGL